MSIWRWSELLAAAGLDTSAPVTLGEGATPLVAVDPGRLLGHDAEREGGLRVKCEHLNPTGSFKDRVAAVAATLARQRGLHGLFGTSSGNGGAAAAAYAAAAGLHAVLCTLPDAPAGKVRQITAVGGLAWPQPGLGVVAEDTLRVARGIAAGAEGAGFLPFLTGADHCPELMIGARTIAWELATEAADATHVYAPVGGGGLFASPWRGYRDLGRRPPHLVAVQPLGCPTLARSLAGKGGAVERTSTSVSGLQVAVLFDSDASRAVREAGHLTEVDDNQVYTAQARLASAGLLVEPAGATALAGYLVDRRKGLVGPDDRVIVVASGAGWKDTASLNGLAARTPPGPPPPALVELMEGLSL